MNKKNAKILKLYIVSFLCIVCYFLLENSTIIPELVEKSNKHRYGSFATFFILALLKYGLLVVGIALILILSFFIIKEKTINKKTHKTLI